MGVLIRRPESDAQFTLAPYIELISTKIKVYDKQKKQSWLLEISIDPNHTVPKEVQFRDNAKKTTEFELANPAMESGKERSSLSPRGLPSSSSPRGA